MQFMKAAKISNVNHVVNHFLKQVVSLKTHINTIHVGGKDYKCESCSKSFPQASGLRIHINTIHEHKDYICESCGKSFSQAECLKKHIHTIHEGHKDYKCESCAKSFSTAQYLKKHIHTIHEGHKDYKCESCSKSFTRAHSFNISGRHELCICVSSKHQHEKMICHKIHICKLCVSHGIC